MPSAFSPAISVYLEKLQEECREKQYEMLHERKPAVADALEAEPAEVQITFLRTVMAEIEVLATGSRSETMLNKMLGGLFPSRPSGGLLSWIEFRALGKVVSSLLRHKLPLQPADLADLVRSYARHLKHIYYCFSIASLLSAVETGTRTAELEEAMQQLRKSIQAHMMRHNTKENESLLERIHRYLNPGRENSLEAGGPWSSAVFLELKEIAEPDQSSWKELFRQCRETQSSVPTKAWRKISQELVAAIGTAKVRDAARRWLDRENTPIVADTGRKMEEKDADYLKGFVWVLAGLPQTDLCGVVADFGLACLRKIPNIGPVSARVGFACINAVAEMPGMEPVAQLTRMRMKVKYAVALKLIEKALNAAAERSGLTRDDLEDLAVPTYGLGADLRILEQLSGCSVELALDPRSGEIEWQWKNSEGKRAKSPPAEIKQNHAARLKELKRSGNEMQKMLVAQRLRMEQFLINERKIGYEHWRKHFLDHPLLSAIAKRLIWRFETGSDATLGAWYEGRLVSWNDEAVTGLSSATVVQLWHPLQSDTQTILSWRCWLEDHQVVQPFKQAHREVYLLTPAEEQTETYSNRFAAHVIRQHQFASLCRERGWQYRLMGSGFDGHNVPAIDLPRRSMRAEFWVETAEVNVAANNQESTDQISGSGINLYLFTDQVRFYHNGQQARLADLPTAVFSEIMRDVDLFVGVTSIGNDPTWGDRGNFGYGEYWQKAAFGELSQSGETRRAILEKLLPQLKIASRCTLEGKFLVVRGDLHTYKIHLGSANVLMEPGSRYLCIVPGRGMGNWEGGHLYLPFDGDHTLAVILSKAMLLAADTKIDDVTILRQMGRPVPQAN